MSDSLYKLLSEDERILSVTSFIGTSSPRFQATYAPNLAGKNYAQFIVNTASVEAPVACWMIIRIATPIISPTLT